MEREDDVRTQGEESHLQAPERGLRSNQPCWLLDLGLPSFQNCEKISVV